MIRRRDFIAGLGVAAMPVFRAAQAQQPGLPVVGFISQSRADTLVAFGMPAFLEGLREGGYIEGRNVALEYRWAEEHLDGLPALAADLVRRQVKVIVPSGVDATLAAKSATTTIPIVFQSGADPVRADLFQV
jgi:putative ABC transport system substrate-binding protein